MEPDRGTQYLDWEAAGITYRFFHKRIEVRQLRVLPVLAIDCDTEAWYDFCSGKLMLCVFVETKAIQDKLSRHGIKSEITGQWDQYPVILTGDESSGKPGETRVGGHFFGRLFTNL